MINVNKHSVDRRRPNILLKWVRHVLRKRAVSLSLVILPQVVGLTLLACMFFLLRVQETLVTPAVLYRRAPMPSLCCIMEPKQASEVPPHVPVRVDLLSPDGRILASGNGKVHSVFTAAGRDMMQVEGPGLATVVQRAKGVASPRVRIRMRVHRVIDIVMAKGGLRR